MRRIIDIPDDVYERAKTTKTIETADYDIVSLYRAVKNSKLYEERPQGKWMNTSPYDIEGTCSLCCYLSIKCYNFCPNCGADMRGGEEE